MERREIQTRISRWRYIVKFQKISKPRTRGSIKKSRNGKATGSDKIPIDLIKNATQKIKERLLTLFNNIVEESQIPENSDRAIMIPIYKKGYQNEPENYRGISLLSCTYKLLAKMIPRRIDSEVDPKILEYQNRFRKGRSCIDGMLYSSMMMMKLKYYKKKEEIDVSFGEASREC